MSNNWSLTPASNGLLVQDNPWGALSRSLNNWDLTVVSPGDRGSLAHVEASFPEFDSRYVLAYPSMLYGRKFGTTPNSGDSPLPVQLTDCDFDILYSWSVDYPAGTEQDQIYNVAIETFFHDSLPITGPGHPSGQNNKVFELMVWFNRPAADLYLGRKLGEYTQNGVTYDVMAQGSRSDYVAFIAQTTVNSGALQWKGFVDETVKHFPSFDPSKLYMSALEMGPEIWKANDLRFFWRQFDVRKKELSTVANTDDGDNMAEAPKRSYCMPADHAHELSLIHHRVSVAHNELAKYYEAIRDGLD